MSMFSAPVQFCLIYLFSLRERCPNTEVFLVRNFLSSDSIQENTHHKKTRIWTFFTHCLFQTFCSGVLFSQKNNFGICSHVDSGKKSSYFLLYNYISNRICYFYVWTRETLEIISRKANDFKSLHLNFWEGTQVT